MSEKDFRTVKNAQVMLAEEVNWKKRKKKREMSEGLGCCKVDGAVVEASVRCEDDIVVYAVDV